MDVPIVVLLIVFLIFQFAFINLDFQRNTNIKQNIFESLRYANQNTLIEIADKYDDFSYIDNKEMFEKWLINFCNSSLLDLSEIKISFIQIETDPIPLFLVNIEGYKDNYIIISKDAYASYTNGTMVLKEKYEKGK